MTDFTKSEKHRQKVEAARLIKKKYDEFIKQFDLTPIVDYFEVGLEAGIFRNKVNDKPLHPYDNLFWGFNHKGFQYTLRRQPIPTAKPMTVLEELADKARISGGVPK